MFHFTHVSRLRAGFPWALSCGGCRHRPIGHVATRKKPFQQETVLNSWRTAHEFDGGSRQSRAVVLLATVFRLATFTPSVILTRRNSHAPIECLTGDS